MCKLFDFYDGKLLTLFASVVWLPIEGEKKASCLVKCMDYIP